MRRPSTWAAAPARLVLAAAVAVGASGAALAVQRLPAADAEQAVEAGSAAAPSPGDGYGTVAARPPVTSVLPPPIAAGGEVGPPAAEPAPPPPPPPPPPPTPVPAAVDEPLGRPGDVPGRTSDSPMPLLDRDQLAATAARAGIPERALAAYASAALLLAEEQPDCRLTWVTLAGVGYVESHHGTIGGRTLRPDGTPSSPIVGVPLDGGPDVRAIRDTDGGRLDGDATWDRAVGPMQFIPSTWARWGADGSGDGRADPQHVDDAALAAARYLCASGGDLTAASSWGRAMFSYNRSDDYVHHVLRVANTYADRANAG